MSPPGTISGSPDPDDRLRAERPEGGFTRGRPSLATQAAEAATSPGPGQRALAVLLLTVVAGFFVLLILNRPIVDLLAAALTAAGLPVSGPSSLPRAEWERLVASQPLAYLIHIVGNQVLFGGLAVAGAFVLGGGIRRNLGFVRPRGGWRVLALAAILEALTFGLGIALLGTFLPTGYEIPEASLARDRMLLAAPLGTWLVLVAGMSLLPGLCEESLFRGLIQRPLLEAWKPWMALSVTALVFTLLHPPLERSLALLPACLWLGYVAWRCGSILPGIVLHAGTNATLLGISRFWPGEAPETWAPTLLDRLGSGATALGCAALAAWLLVLVHRWTKVPSTGPGRADPTGHGRGAGVVAT